MITLLTILHVVVSIFLIGIVLLQHGKGADIGATFGGSSQTVFGSDGPLPLLNKVTTGAAILFMMTSLTLAYNSAHKSNGSVMENVPAPPPMSVPATVPGSAANTPMEGSTETAAPTPVSSTFPGSEKEAAPTPVTNEAAQAPAETKAKADAAPVNPAPKSDSADSPAPEEKGK